MTSAELGQPKNYHCISLRCRLCRFPFAQGDQVIISVDGRLSSAFAFGSSHVDKESGQVFWPCSTHCRYCHHGGDRSLSYHPECLTFTSQPPSDATLRATSYSFEPGCSEERRRRKWILDLLIDRLSKTHSRLPMELRLLIARDLVHECAIVATQQAWQTHCSRDCDVDISLDIWAEYVYLDGVRYIAYISNEATSTARMIMNAHTSLVTVLYVQEDHLGIRQLVFSGSKERKPSIDTEQNLWWRTVPLTSKLKIRSDGLKLRSISTTSVWPKRAWRVPMALPELEALHFTRLAPDLALQSDNFRMLSLDINAPGITGYSACWAGNVIMLYAHNGTGDSVFYKEISASYAHAVWIYMPIDYGEHISEIWGRRGKHYDHMGLLLRTNTGKQTVFALYPSSRLILQNDSQTPKWKHLYTLLEKPTRLFFDLSRPGIHRLATNSVDQQKTVLSIPTPISFPKGYRVIDYFYSSASLEGVEEITICMVESVPHSHISGLLFLYANGRRACVGEVRLDSLRETLKVSSSSTLHIASTWDTSGRCHVARLSLHDPPEKESFEWLSLGWTGVLEWWFAFGHCRLFHMDK